jgi:hypothetical protein
LNVLRPRINGNYLSLFGSEASKYVEPLEDFQRMNLIQNSDPNCRYNRTIAANYSVALFAIRQNNQTIIDPHYTGYCRGCNLYIQTDVQFLHRPNFLLVKTTKKGIKIDHMPKNLVIDNMNFRLISCTLHTGNHFLGVFLIDDQNYLVDDLTQRVTLLGTFDPNNREHIQRTSQIYHYFRSLSVNVSYYLKVD